jgi:hypothetical protein
VDNLSGKAIDPEYGLALLDELVLPVASGGRKPAEVIEVHVVRALVPADLPELRRPSPLGMDLQRLVKTTAAHHQLARLLSEGRPHVEVSQLTGYSQSYISLLIDDPSFEELLASYASQREQVFVDVAERMKVLGLSAVDEIASRLESAPDEWTRQQLMDLAELMLLKGRAGPGSTSGAGPQGGVAGPVVQVNVKFVTAAPRETSPGVTIEQERV